MDLFSQKSVRLFEHLRDLDIGRPGRFVFIKKSGSVVSGKFRYFDYSGDSRHVFNAFKRCEGMRGEYCYACRARN